MARTRTNAEMTTANKAVVDEAKLKKGNQRLRVCRAMVDPTSYCHFSVLEDILGHFEIDTVPDNLADTDVPFVARKIKTVAGPTKKVEGLGTTGAGDIERNNRSIVGRAIKIPTSGGLTRNIAGVQKPIKFVTIRVPAIMTYSAVCLWINTCFKQATKKPTYFITQAGQKVNIAASFTDKAKLPNKKNE